jgi:hypothetical protein
MRICTPWLGRVSTEVLAWSGGLLRGAGATTASVDHNRALDSWIASSTQRLGKADWPTISVISLSAMYLTDLVERQRDAGTRQTVPGRRAMATLQPTHS